MVRGVPQRQDIALEDRWNTESIFASPEAWETEGEAILAQLPTLLRFKGHLGDGAATLADWFEASEALLIRLGQLEVYATLVHAVDMSNQAVVSIYDRARSLSARVNSALAFAEPEILSIGFDRLRQWMQEESRLAIYEHYFGNLERLQKHVRSVEVEELLNQLADPFRMVRNIHVILTDVDLDLEPIVLADEFEVVIPIAQGNIRALLSDKNREVRRQAWEKYADAHLQYKNTMANIVTTTVKQHLFMARARGYTSSLEAAMTPHRIPTDVFHNLIATFRNNLPIWHRYWRVRKQALGYDKLYDYDIKAPLTSQSPQIKYQQAVDWICDGMKPLGEEYVRVMRRGCLQERWVDIYPNQGKRAGAFSHGTIGTYPFILMNHNDDIFGLSTLAHELGHSMHSYYTRRRQPYIYARYSTFLAEVASNFNQVLTRDYLLKNNPDPSFQIALLEEAFSNFHRYYFIMPTLARFEFELHQRVEQGKGLTANNMISLMSDLFHEGYGGEVELDLERIGITWAEFSTHMHLDFYVYMYATGIAAAHALGDKVLSGEANAVPAYLTFLKSGCSRYPLDVLKTAGVDMTTPEAVQKGFDTLSNMVDRLEALVS